MKYFNSLFFSVFLFLIFICTTSLALYFNYTTLNTVELIEFAIGFSSVIVIKGFIGALIAWFFVRKHIDFACVLNIALVVIIVNQVLSDFFMAFLMPLFS